VTSIILTTCLSEIHCGAVSRSPVLEPISVLECIFSRAQSGQGASMYDESEKPHALVCTEVWGGNRKVIRTIKLPSLVAWVASVPIEEGEGGGDLHYMSVCDHDVISRVALADVSGHGHDANAVTQTLRKLMREYINSWDQSDFMRGLNNTFGQDGNEKYATAIVLSFHRVTGRLAFSNAGHLPPIWYHAAQRDWGWLEEGSDPNAKKVSGVPVGLIPGSNYSQTVVTLKPSDFLVLYTDGITEAENGAGQYLGREQLLEWARQAPLHSPRALGEDLLKRLELFRGRFRNDDATLVVLQRDEESRFVALGKVASSFTFGRLLRSLKKGTVEPSPQFRRANQEPDAGSDFTVRTVHEAVARSVHRYS
jgi:phosphoserine phosphatase RsbU/P